MALSIPARRLVLQSQKNGQRKLAEVSFGGEGQNRTADLGVFSATLYRLSYLTTAIIVITRGE